MDAVGMRMGQMRLARWRDGRWRRHDGAGRHQRGLLLLLVLLLCVQMLVQRVQLAGGEVMRMQVMRIRVRVRNANGVTEVLLQLQVLLLQQLLLELLVLLLVQMQLRVLLALLVGPVAVRIRVGGRRRSRRGRRMAEDVGNREALDALQTRARQRRTGGARSRVLDALQALQRSKVVVAGLMAAMVALAVVVLVMEADVMRGVVAVWVVQEMVMDERMRFVRRRTGRTDRDLRAGWTGQRSAGAEHVGYVCVWHRAVC